MSVQWIDRMAVEVDGDGEPVVLVHGLGGTTNTWTTVMAALTRQRAVRIELPGSGRSKEAHALRDNTPHAGRLSIDVLVDAVLRVCGELGIAGAHFVGHSLGTIVCQHLAVKAPDRVRSLALFGPLGAPPEAARTGLKARAAKVRAEGMFGVADGIVQAALSATTREQSPVAVAFVRESLLAQDADGYARTCEALAAAEPAPIDHIRTPALLVAGDEDAVAPVHGARALAARLGGARVETLPRCGHWMTVERPSECRAFLQSFLERQR
jgi:pimeloyl-ACP methyl ester carboxylesterase